jgi:hypothetical protein
VTPPADAPMPTVGKLISTCGLGEYFSPSGVFPFAMSAVLIRHFLLATHRPNPFAVNKISARGNNSRSALSIWASIAIQK